jgi:CHAT domain-containing protein/Tfp pilus assembly protein PilF
MTHPYSRIQHRYRSWIVYCNLVLFVAQLLVPIQAAAGVIHQAQVNQSYRQLESGKPIERELLAGQNHSYQVTLASGQYIKVAVDQRGIDVIVKLFGPDGRQIAFFDTEPRNQGIETASWVAEEVGNYRLDVVTKQKNAAAGRYEIKVAELRTATGNDRTIFEANKLYAEFVKLGSAGQYNEARPVGERIVALREKALGANHPDIAQVLNDLAFLYNIMGDDKRAEQLYKRALEIWEKTLGPEHPVIAHTRSNIAGIYLTRGDYVPAEAEFQLALEIDMKVSGPKHPDIAQDYNNLGEVYRERGDYAKAESLYKSAIDIWEETLGPEHPFLAEALNNIALIYQARTKYEQAEASFQRAITIWERAVGPEHPIITQAFINMGNLWKERGDYAKAEPFYERALSIRKKALGPDSFAVTQVLCNLAVIYRKRSDYAKAGPLFESTMKSLESILGSDHSYIAEALNELALFYTSTDDIGQAITTLSRANSIDERILALTLAGGSERQKIAFIDKYSKWTNFTLSLHSEFAPNDPQALNLAFKTVLNRKARGLDAMADTIATLRRNATQEDRERFDKLQESRSQLATLVLKEPDATKLDTYRTRVKYLEESIDELEGKLSTRYRNFRKQSQSITLSAVQAAVPPHTALIEFAYFTPIDPKTEKSEPPRYLAYLLAPQGQPNWVDLGEAAPIEQAIDAWRKALRNPNRADVKPLARALDEMVMKPVREVLGDLQGNPTNLLISPDGSLNLIPFQALVDEQNQFLVEHYSITYLTSGRDLLRLQNSDRSKSEALLIANPDFGRLATMAMRGGRTSAQIDPARLYFAPLPATEDEALAIKAILPKASLLDQADATETALKHTSGPKILHIATHGFFLDYQGPSPAGPGQQPRESSPGKTLLASTRSMPYTIQFEASPALETAQEKVKELKSRGIDAYIVKTEVKGKGSFFRVRAGNFRTQTEAQNYGADLRGRGTVSDFFVARYESPQVESKNQLADLRLSKFATKIKDPLLRSGLALAGANQGKSGDDDGVLTALEAAYLDLIGTKLVVLSACDTGVGEVRNGEGVQGLRRALVLAGSESQVMSLWPVSDEATKDLMIPYYKALEDGKGRSEGLRQVQLRMVHGRRDRQHPFYWAAFIQSGEWANLDGQR